MSVVIFLGLAVFGVLLYAFHEPTTRDAFRDKWLATRLAALLGRMRFQSHVDVQKTDALGRPIYNVETGLPDMERKPIKPRGILHEVYEGLLGRVLHNIKVVAVTLFLLVIGIVLLVYIQEILPLVPNWQEQH